MEKDLRLPNNSMFVVLHQKKDPKIAIAVTVENAGFGSTWLAYCTDLNGKISERYFANKKQEDLERISNTN
jgi:cell division protein FtsI/penicillin-binding protein 2